MADHHFVVLSRATEGRQADFERWYDDQHLGDVKKVPGVSGARRYRIREASEGDWESLAVYDLEGPDPQAVVKAVLSRAYTDAMPISDAMAPNVLRFLVEAV